MKRSVRVVDRSTWGTPGPYPLIRTVEVEWVCPQCGGPRGEPWEDRFYENDDYHRVHRWSNPCGHVDMYDDLLKEAMI